MNRTSNSGFVHSIKVPRIYKTASVIIKKVVEEGASLKDLVYSCGHKNIKGVYALVVEAIKHSQELDKVIKNSKLLKKETRLQPWLARILLTELLYGKKELKGESKPVQTVLRYRDQVEKIIKNQKNSNSKSKNIAKKPRYVRVNTLFNTPDEIIKKFRIEGWNFIPSPEDYSEFLSLISNLDENSFTRDFHIKELLVFSGNVQFYENELYLNCSLLLQDKASCLPAHLLKPSPNSVVLDMCAAPGMKTTHLCAIMKNKGKIYAAEVNPKRYNVLCDFVKHSGCSNVTTLNIDALELNLNGGRQDLDLSWCKDVEYILVDPSCSGSGIAERVKIFSEEKSDPKRLKKLYGFQFKLLQHALTNFPRVKKVVYSTCSVYPQENEVVVEDMLNMLNNPPEENVGKSFPKFRLAEPLKDTWVTRGSDEFEHGKCCIFADLDKDLTNGFFVAVFERIDNENENGNEEEGEVEISEKKKKKKKRKEETEDVVKQNLEDEEKDENLKKKTKKKKEESENGLELQNVQDEVEENLKKKKKRKESEDVLELQNFQNEVEEILKKKKKKRKKESENISNIQNFQNDEEENLKKKKKKGELESEDVQNTENIQNEDEILKKKKKKKKEKEEEICGTKGIVMTKLK